MYVLFSRYGRKQKDIADFEKAIKKLRIGDDFESSSMIEEFYKSKKIVVSELTGGNSQKLNDSQKMVKKLQEELDKVYICIYIYIYICIYMYVCMYVCILMYKYM
jgi:hypothetical protein